MTQLAEHSRCGKKILGSTWYEPVGLVSLRERIKVRVMFLVH
jgi:hypothetical protein